MLELPQLRHYTAACRHEPSLAGLLLSYATLRATDYATATPLMDTPGITAVAAGYRCLRELPAYYWPVDTPLRLITSLPALMPRHVRAATLRRQPEPCRCCQLPLALA